MNLRRGSMAVATSAVAALALVGCGSNSLGGDTKKATVDTGVDSAAAAMVPQAIKDKGTLVVGSDASYAPSEFLAGDGTTVEGFDVDLFTAVAKKLGLKVEFQNASFDTIITGVQGGKYDVGVSSFTVNTDREKQVNMVSYFSAGTQWSTKKGNPNHIDPNNACGAKVAVQKATVQADDVTARSKKCTAAGKKAIQVDQYQGQDQATAAVVSGKDQAMLADSPVIAYGVVQTNGQMEKLGAIYDSAPYGYVVPKKDMAFADALAGALKALIKDGTYKKILDAWYVGDGAMSNPQVNPPATS